MAKNGLRRFFVHQLRERRGAFRLAAKAHPQSTAEVFTGEGRKRDLLHLSAGVLDRLKLARQRMSASTSLSR